MALVASAPDRFLPIVLDGTSPSSAAPPTPGLPDDYADIINSEGLLTPGDDVVLKYETVPEVSEVEDVMRMIQEAQGGVVLGPSDLSEPSPGEWR